MNKKIGIFLILLMAFTVVSAICTPNNEFTLGDEINICTGSCFYENESNSSEFLSCDSSVTCRLTAFDENLSLIVAYENMDREDNIYNYSLGFLNITGTFPAVINCYRTKGLFETSFTFSISSSSEVNVLVGSNANSNTFYSIGINGSERNLIIEDSKAETIKALFPYIVGGLIFIVVLVMGAIVRIFKQ